jgi:hypothetical protein
MSSRVIVRSNIFTRIMSPAIQIVPTVLMVGSVISIGVLQQILGYILQTFTRAPVVSTRVVVALGILEFVVVELVLPTRDTRQKVVVQQLVMGMVILAAQPIPVAVPVVPVLQLVLLMVFLIAALVPDVQVR